MRLWSHGCGTPRESVYWTLVLFILVFHRYVDRDGTKVQLRACGLSDTLKLDCETEGSIVNRCLGR